MFNTKPQSIFISHTHTNQEVAHALRDAVLREMFVRWYPAMAMNDMNPSPAVAA